MGFFPTLSRVGKNHFHAIVTLLPNFDLKSTVLRFYISDAEDHLLYFLDILLSPSSLIYLLATTHLHK